MILTRYLFVNNIKQLSEKERKNPDGYYSRHIFSLNESFYDLYRENQQKMLATIYDTDRYHIYVVCAYRGTKVSSDICKSMISEKLNHGKLIEEREITISEYSNLLARASSHDYLSQSERSIMNKLEINIDPRPSFFTPPLYKHEEEVFSDKLPNKKELLAEAEKILASDSLKKEIGRIYSSSNARKFLGHPIHYYITAGDWGAAQDIVRVLIKALLKNKRLISRRVAYVQDISPNCYSEPSFDNVFNSAIGSTVVIDLSGERNYGNYATGYQRNAEIMGKKLAALGKETLFIFVEISDRIVYRDETLAAILGADDIVKIEEGYGNHERALAYFNDLIDRSEFCEYDRGECDRYLPDKLTYTVSDVYEAYNKWYGNGLKSHVYKAYRNFETVKIEVKKKDGDPYRKLKEMVGLTQIKEIVDQIIVHEKIRCKRKELGLDTANSCRHMLFYGNPGSAKTTVARLLAQILKEEGVLENGHMVECGRQNLVARYVGWTAKAVEEKFREARGGVLFIDEAYSLLEEHNTFGTEAINTIVQLMENYRDEVIVIFAGYPDKMRDFVRKNEGLASRIAFQLDFPDYSSDELVGILKLMLKDSEYRMSDAAIEKCRRLFDRVSMVKDYGNGRFVRNVLEQIELRQSERIAREYADMEVDAEQIAMIEAEDVMDEYNILGSERNTKIGYVS